MTDQAIAPDTAVSGAEMPLAQRLPLSFAQQQLWFLQQLAPDMTAYHVHVANRLSGPLDIAVLRRALTHVLRRHEILRSTYHSDDGTPYQIIGPPCDAILEVVDHPGLTATDRDAVVEREFAAVHARPFDLTTGPLNRFLVVRLADDDHAFAMYFHHIVIDGWSMTIFNTELAASYRAFLAGVEPDLPELDVRYRDFVAAQQDWSARELPGELDYWQQRLAALPALELPADRPRSRNAMQGTDAVVHDLDPALVRDLRAFASEHGASLFVLLTTAFNVVLARYSGQYDIPVGVAMLGRTDPDLEYVIGIFVNMVVLRSDLSGDPTFAELFGRTDDAVLDLFDHQDAPFEKVVERVQPAREPGRNPLFQVAVQMLEAANSGGGLELGELGVDSLGIGLISAMFDLNLNFFEVETGLRAHLSYATELFDRWRIENLLSHLEQVLRAGIADPSLPLSQLPLMSAEERDRVRQAGQGAAHVDPEEPVHVTVAAVAAAQPDTTAAVCKGIELSYRDLDHRAEQLARHINATGVGHEQVVAIAMDRDLDTLIAMLAVWKAGAAFTMLDPRHPAARLEFILRDTGAPLLITRAELASSLPEGEWRTLLLDQEQATIDAIAVTEPLPSVSTRDSLAYVLYTSGSTGHPKGVLIEHRALRCFTEAYQRTFDFGPGDRLQQLPALTFDMSQGEIWTALTCGATLVQVSRAEGESPEALSALMREQRVTYAGLTPPLLSLLEAGPYPDLRYVMGGADTLPAELVNKWNLPGRRFVNLYGPTEAAVACTEYECEHVTLRFSPPIGGPEYNRLLYVVDTHGNLVPQGVPGELLIGGDEGLARGYLNQPELTAEKFVPDPFRDHGLVYRSGDLVRWTADWQLDFLGRIDSQIKLRGLRIELGEIESALLTHPGIRMAVVLAHTDPRGDKQLVGYYTPSDDSPPEPAELRAYLAKVLPEYMVPTYWVRTAEFALTGARKIDRKALPAPDFGIGGTDRPFVEPKTPTEQGVAEIFTLVLSGDPTDRIGADTNFFEVGGNSLQAMRAVSRINKAFGIRVNVRLLYGSKSVSAIATAVDELLAQKPVGR